MQNKALKQRENQGWHQLRKQLDVELPLDKKDNKKFLWFFLLGLIALGGLTWLTVNKPAKPILIESQQTNKQLLEETALNNSNETKAPSSSIATQKTSSVATTSSVDSKSESIAESHTQLPSTTPLSNKSVKKTNSSKIDQSTNSVKNTSSVVSVTKPTSQKQVTVDPKSVTEAMVQDQTIVKSNPSVSAVPEGNKSNTNKVDQSGVITEIQIAQTLQSNEGNKEKQSEIVNEQAQIANTDIDAKSETPQVMTGLEVPISLDVPSVTKNRRRSINAAMEYSSDRFFSSTIQAGNNWPIGKKLYISGQAGLGFQYNKSKSAVVESYASQSNSPGKGNYDALNSTVFPSVSAGKVFLDNTRSISGFRGDTLVLSAKDEIIFDSRNQWMALIQAGMGYQLNSFWFIESGLHLRSYLNASQDLLAVNYTNGIGTGGGFNNGFPTTSIYKLNPVSPRVQWSWYFNTGIAITKTWGIQLQYNATPLVIKTGKRVRAESLDSGGNPGVATPTLLELPIKESTGSFRMGLQYKF